MAVGDGATPKPELATDGAATPAGEVVAAGVTAGAVGVKMLVVGTRVALVVGLLVTVTVSAGVAE